MNKQSILPQRKTLRDVLLFVASSFLVLFASPALPQTTPKLPGELWVGGTVEVNGKTATSGMTVLSGQKIKTRENSSATINLGKKLGRIKLQPETEMIVSFTSETIGGQLLKGQAVLTAPTGIAIDVATTAGKVASNNRRAATLMLQANTAEISVGAARGDADIQFGDRTEHVATGEEVTVCTSCATEGAAGGAAGGATSSSQVSRKTLFIVGGAAAAAATTAAILAATSGNDSPLSDAPTVTPTVPTATDTACGCLFSASNGSVLNPNQITTICHVVNGQRETLALSCANFSAHFNANGTPRAGHEQDICGACPVN